MAGYGKLRNERETLGFFITGHPLDKYVGRFMEWSPSQPTP